MCGPATDWRAVQDVPPRLFLAKLHWKQSKHHKILYPRISHHNPSGSQDTFILKYSDRLCLGEVKNLGESAFDLVWLQDCILQTGSARFV